MVLDWPLAFHITFGTYGARLHGGDRPTVDKLHNQYGEPMIEQDSRRLERAVPRQTHATVRFDNDKRLYVEQVVPGICQRGGWTYYICAAQPDHVHNLVSAKTDGQVVRRLLKRWLSESLSERWRDEEIRSWWAEGGSVKWIWKEE